MKVLRADPETDEQYEAGLHELFPAYMHSVDAADVLPHLEGTIYDAAAMRHGFEILAQWSSVDRLDQVTVPVFLGVGRHDAFTAFPQSYRIAGRLPEAEVVVYEDSGHFPWLEEPGHVFASINAWLTQHDLA
jgi:proline iminopeptidase